MDFIRFCALFFTFRFDLYMKMRQSIAHAYIWSWNWKRNQLWAFESLSLDFDLKGPRHHFHPTFSSSQFFSSSMWRYFLFLSWISRPNFRTSCHGGILFFWTSQCNDLYRVNRFPSIKNVFTQLSRTNRANCIDWTANCEFAHLGAII